MKLQKKHYIGMGIALVSISGALAYMQFKKIMNYSLVYKGVRNVTFNKDKLSLTILYDYTNKANIDVTLEAQEYDVYIDNVFMTKMFNYAPNVLKASQTSEIAINVDLNLKELSTKLGKDIYARMLLDPKNVMIKFDMKWKVKLLGLIKLPVSYPYVVSLKEILSWYIPAIKK